MKCQECGFNCHKKCAKFLSSLCGINQKILSELVLALKDKVNEEDALYGEAKLVSESRLAPTPMPRKGMTEDDPYFNDIYVALNHPDARFEMKSTDETIYMNAHAAKELQEMENRFCRLSVEEEVYYSLEISKIQNDAVRRGKSSRRTTVNAATPRKSSKLSLLSFNLVKVLGRGSFGKVMLAELRATGQFYAIKALKKEVILEDNDIESTFMERRVLELGNMCPFLATAYASFQSASHLFLVMEYLSGGDLLFHIQREKRFSQENATFYGAEIIVGLQFLHNKGIIYRDLKPDNILLSREGHIKIADFGLCKENILGPNRTTTLCGTAQFMAPEVYNKKPYNCSVDWFSFGVVMFEMLTGTIPFEGEDDDDIQQAILYHNAKYPRYLKSESVSFLKGLLDKRSEQRLGMPQCPAGPIRNHAFLKHVDWSKMELGLVTPPFVPKIKNGDDCRYFDLEFTEEPPELSPIDKYLLQSVDQTQFHGFSFMAKTMKT